MAKNDVFYSVKARWRHYDVKLEPLNDVTKFPNHLDTNEVKKDSIYSQETMDKLGIFRNIRMIWFDKTIWIFFIFIERIADL